MRYEMRHFYAGKDMKAGLSSNGRLEVEWKENRSDNKKKTHSGHFLHQVHFQKISPGKKCNILEGWS